MITPVDEELRRYLSIILIGLFAGIIGFAFWKRPAMIMPSEEAVYGCYFPSTLEAPRIKVDSNGFAINQDELESMPFSVEYHKQYTLTVHEPLTLERDGDVLRYRVLKRGIGTFFGTGVKAAREGEAPLEFAGFDTYSMDFGRIFYTRKPLSDCPS